MDNLNSLTTFLGWCSVLNLALLIYATLMLTILRSWVKGLHAKWFGIDPKGLEALYFSYLGHYKLAIIMFNLVPYCALKIMA